MKEKEIKNYIKENKIDLGKIVDDYTPYIKSVINNMVNDNLSEEDKEEIITDTFFILWKRSNEEYEIKLLKSYLAGIAKNLTKQKLRKKQKIVDISQYENNEEYSYTETYIEERKDIDKLLRKINKLKERDKQIIKMYYYLEKSIKDIAKELNMTETNVKTKLHRIRKKIRREMV